MTVQQGRQTPRPLLLGHRGARGVRSIRENTITSFDRALADGGDGFEFDVRLTVDGEAVVCHDPKSGRVEIARATFEQLPGLVLLRDVFSRYSAAFLDIELKVAGLEEILVGALKSQPLQRFVVSSFLPEVLRAVHAADESVPLGLICETKAELRQWHQLPVAYVIPHHTLADRNLIRELQGAGKKVLVWTVNTAADMQRFAAWGVDGLISDHPKRLVGTLATRRA
jgi:glycerophosphoryl diester phosphodiesterase